MLFSAYTLHSISIAVVENAPPRTPVWSFRSPAVVRCGQPSRSLCATSPKHCVSLLVRNEQLRFCKNHHSMAYKSCKNYHSMAYKSCKKKHSMAYKSSPRRIGEGLKLSVTRKTEQDIRDNRTARSRFVSRLFALPEDVSGDDDYGWDCKDEYGPYPWDPAWHSLEDSSFEWIHEEIITFFTAEGVVRIESAKLPRHTLRKQGIERMLGRQRRYKEEDYMDPKQGLCLGAIFDIAATNGLDINRRFCVFGFCRSIEMLSDVVEDTVRDQGGEVVVAEKKSVGGLHEKLKMTVAMPLLWGVPPAMDSLNYAIRSGGGIVERAYRRWEFL